MRWSTPPTPGVLAPDRVMLSRSIITYSTPSAPLAGTSQLHRTAAYMRCLSCAGAPRPPARSGRTMARSGLRMMPTFPSSPLRFRTASFPQYGSKAGLSDRAFPDRASVKLAPSIPVAWSGLPPSFVLSAAAWIPRSESEATCSVEHRHESDLVARLQGPSLRSGLCCPGPSTLNRPHPPHSQAHHNFIV